MAILSCRAREMGVRTLRRARRSFRAAAGAGSSDHGRRLSASSIVDEPGVHCCYAKGDKHWVTDPQGIAWEAFQTLDSIPFFNAAVEPATTKSTCCAPGP
jgi:hypothetical protein